MTLRPAGYRHDGADLASTVTPPCLAPYFNRTVQNNPAKSTPPGWSSGVQVGALAFHDPRRDRIRGQGPEGGSPAGEQWGLPQFVSRLSRSR